MHDSPAGLSKFTFPLSQVPSKRSQFPWALSLSSALLFLFSKVGWKLSSVLSSWIQPTAGLSSPVLRLAECSDSAEIVACRVGLRNKIQNSKFEFRFSILTSNLEEREFDFFKFTKSENFKAKKQFSSILIFFQQSKFKVFNCSELQRFVDSKRTSSLALIKALFLQLCSP